MIEFTAELCEEYAAYIRYQAREHCRHRPWLDVEDLTQEGILGLRRACQDFDPARRLQLLTHARHWIRHYMQEAVRQNTPGITVPAREVKLKRRRKHVLPLKDVPKVDQADLEPLRRALDALSPNQRYVYDALAEGKDHKQIARSRKADDWTAFTVGLLVASGRKRFGEAYQPDAE